MRAMGRNPTEEELINIMNEIDVDHNGTNVTITFLHIFPQAKYYKVNTTI